jgi:two-component system cell cycle response regulator
MSASGSDSVFESVASELGVKFEYFPLTTQPLAMSFAQKPIAIVVDVDFFASKTKEFEQILYDWVGAFDTHSIDVVGVSEYDSTQTAMQCYRAGFSEFILKSAEKENLVWAMKRCLHRRHFLEKLRGPENVWARAVAQISACTSITQMRLLTLQSLQTLMQAEGGAWVTQNKGERPVLYSERVHCNIPRYFGEKKLKAPPLDTYIRRFDGLPYGSPPQGALLTTDLSNVIYLRCSDAREGGIILWGVPAGAVGRYLAKAGLVLEHTELSLRNLQKLDEIKNETLHDELTGLYNVKQLKKTLLNLTVGPNVENRKFSLLFIDIDKFKTVNDTFGHLVGSDCLTIIAKTLTRAVRDTDTVYRYGGDEFVVVLHQAGAAEAQIVAERIRRLIEERIFAIREFRLRLTVSIGLALFPDHATDRETLIQMADQAMYQVKRNQRNAVYVAAPAKRTEKRPDVRS